MVNSMNEKWEITPEVQETINQLKHENEKQKEYMASPAYFTDNYERWKETATRKRESGPYDVPYCRDRIRKYVCNDCCREDIGGTWEKPYSSAMSLYQETCRLCGEEKELFTEDE